MTKKTQNIDKILIKAEKWKRRRKANWEKYRKNDALNDKYKWAMLGAKSPTENIEWLKQKAFEKKLCRECKKEMASFEVSVMVEE